MASGSSSAGIPPPLSVDPHQVQSAALGRNVDPRRPGVDGVFHQLLDHARRPFDDLAGRDLVDEGLGKTRMGMGMRDEG